MKKSLFYHKVMFEKRCEGREGGKISGERVIKTRDQKIAKACAVCVMSAGLVCVRSTKGLVCLGRVLVQGSTKGEEVWEVEDIMTGLEATVHLGSPPVRDGQQESDTT